jgi:hypothetical protein
MPITIDGRKYNVGRAAGSFVNILVDPAVSASWRKTYKRSAGPEHDASFQARVQAEVTRMQRDKVHGLTVLVPLLIRLALLVLSPPRPQASSCPTRA